MNYQSFPNEQRFACLFHDGSGQWPKGWPAETNPLEDGQAPPNGYAEHTGADLNRMRAKLHTAHQKVCGDIRAEEARKSARRAKDIETASSITCGFEWPSGSGQFFSTSVAAQLNCVHDAQDDAFPVTRETQSGDVVSLDEKQFREFYAAMRAFIRGHLADGNAAKATA